MRTYKVEINPVCVAHILNITAIQQAFAVKAPCLNHQ